ncbi:TetR/AcrR family transcriptional regulator [Pseudomonas sp. FME51]|uniref:TetR/AcrR family transcriptional regulator n=1 Tax=Pseudomonas sp. FME51 TaxID=2742609 RepID=UPI001868A9C7|nr:TetR/AcrR family transcriptional regulator [Pseudomonas sp. FME51]
MNNKIPPVTRSKPLKRPTQARARFTVQAIFDTYVRIWQRDGWTGLTTRAVALEAGVAVGTLYDYFPSKEALHSAYVRHCIERLIQAVDLQVVQPTELGWQQRIHLLIQLLSGMQREELSWFHPDMMELEPLIAEQKYQLRAYAELLAMWQRVMNACTDLPKQPDGNLIEALHLAVWGGRRYAMQLRLDEQRMRAWAEQMEALCLARLG